MKTQRGEAPESNKTGWSNAEPCQEKPPLYQALKERNLLLKNENEEITQMAKSQQRRRQSAVSTKQRGRTTVTVSE
jgi:hypothetical protein